MAFENSIDDIKQQLNIVDVIGREVRLKRSGVRYMGLCPFHNEKTPSFSVNEEMQFFHCFGCGRSGDVVHFIMYYYKLPFLEAVDKLCTDYGIKKPEWNSRAPKIDYDRYYAINAKAARFYYNCLGKVPNKGIAYLTSRGLKKETITSFGLGYAPPGGTALTDYLRSEGASDEELIKIGLSNKGNRGLYDKFRDRVIFPIINTSEKVIGFGGRAIGDGIPKYLNSPESEIFLKKNNLFGLNLSRKEIADEDRAIIVEGYMDLISLYQAGIKNVVASLGTALTDNQAKLLCRYSKNIVLSYDSDEAGIKAALRGISVLQAAGGKVRVMNITDGKDPDDFVKKHGREGFYKLVERALPATDYRLRLAARGLNLKDDREVLDYIERVVPILRSVGPVEQDIYIRKLSEQFGISEHAISLAVNSDNEGKRAEGSNRTAAVRRWDIRQDQNLLERVEISFLMLATTDYRYLNRFAEDGIIFRTALAEKIKKAAESLASNIKPGNIGIEAAEIARLLEPDDEAAFSKYLSTIKIGSDDEAFYKQTKAGYFINNYRVRKSELQSELAVAEKLGNIDEIERIAANLIDIDTQINILTEESNG
ncbi:MAG: DNA primase [Mogibacterium sp.]|nr:DNA primase [Mogibacterium sp.]